MDQKLQKILDEADNLMMPLTSKLEISKSFGYQDPNEQAIYGVYMQNKAIIEMLKGYKPESE